MPLLVFAVRVTEPPSAFRAVHGCVTGTSLAITGYTSALEVRSVSLFFLRDRGGLCALQGGPVRLEDFGYCFPYGAIHWSFRRIT